MEYTLQTIYYFIRSFINLLFQMPVVNGVSIGGIFFSVIGVTVLLSSFGFLVKDTDNLQVSGIRLKDGKKTGWSRKK